jgi:adenosylhomocysteine nucleosidase
MTPASVKLKPQGSVLVCFALKEEAAPFRKIIAGKSGVSILVVGIGRQNAERSLREFLADVGGAGVSTSRSKSEPSNQTGTLGTPATPSLVLTCGFAGGLNPDLKLGDALFDTADEELSSRILASGAKPARFFCADRIATTVGEKKTLRDQTGADVVEMESAAIQDVCREQGIPCATVRVISDTASEDLPLDFNALAKPDKNLDFGKLFLAIARSPGKIGALVQLQKKTNFAAQQLSAVLQRVTFP